MTDRTRRGLLAAIGASAAALAGCTSATGSSETATPTEVTADVSYATWQGTALNESSYESEPNEDVFQLSLELDSAAEGVTRVDATLVTGEGSQMATWLLPEQSGETRILGSRNIYDAADVVNPEEGDVVEVRAWRDGTSTVTERFEI